MNLVEKKVKEFNIFLIYLLPIFIIFSNFFANLVTILVSVTFIFFNIKKKLFFQNWIIAFFIFNLYLIFNPSNFINFKYIFFDLKNILKIIFFLRFPIFFYALVYWLIDDAKQLKIILIILISCILFVSIDIIYQYFFKIDILGFEAGLINDELKTFSRYSGPFGDELIGGSYLLRNSIILFSLIQYFLSKKNITCQSNYILLIVAALSITACVLSGERVASFKIIIIFFLFIIFFVKNYKFKLVTFSSIIIILCLLFTFSNSLKTRYFNQTYKEIGTFKNITSNSFHYNHYILAITNFKQNKIFGTGTRSFRNVCGNFTSDSSPPVPSDLGCSTHPHNYFLEILSEQGLVGIILFTIFIFSFLTHYLKNNKHIVLFSVILFFPFLPTGSFYSSWDNTNFWLVLSILLLIKKKI